MHYWGDGFKYFAEVGEAAYEIELFCRRWGRFGGQSKEKFGTSRFYARFGCISLHALIYPGYVYSQFPNWLWKLDRLYIAPTLRFLFRGLLLKWQKYIYRKAYKRTIAKHPYIREEILCGADYDEYLCGL